MYISYIEYEIGIHHMFFVFCGPPGSVAPCSKALHGAYCCDAGAGGAKCRNNSPSGSSKKLRPMYRHFWKGSCDPPEAPSVFLHLLRPNTLNSAILPALAGP